MQLNSVICQFEPFSKCFESDQSLPRHCAQQSHYSLSSSGQEVCTLSDNVEIARRTRQAEITILLDFVIVHPISLQTSLHCARRVSHCDIITRKGHSLVLDVCTANSAFWIFSGGSYKKSQTVRHRLVIVPRLCPTAALLPLSFVLRMELVQQLNDSEIYPYRQGNTSIFNASPSDCTYARPVKLVSHVMVAYHV